MTLKLQQVPQVQSAERVQTSYKQLSLASIGLNAASDDLVEAVSVFDAAFQRLNLGISAWVTLSGNNDEDGDWWSRNLGYAKVGDKWGVALTREAGNYNSPDRDLVEEWLFKDAPRWMRIEAIGKIPELLDALLKETEETTKKLKNKTEETLALAAAMSKVLDEAKPAGQK
jgi:hypothetical protein